MVLCNPFGMANLVILCREDVKFLGLFEKAGLRIVRTEMQKGSPDRPTKLLPVKTYALRPKAATNMIEARAMRNEVETALAESGPSRPTEREQ